MDDGTGPGQGDATDTDRDDDADTGKDDGTDAGMDDGTDGVVSLASHPVGWAAGSLSCTFVHTFPLICGCWLLAPAFGAGHWLFGRLATGSGSWLGAVLLCSALPCAARPALPCPPALPPVPCPPLPLLWRWRWLWLRLWRRLPGRPLSLGSGAWTLAAIDAALAFRGFFRKCTW